MKRGASARGLEHWRILYLDGIHFSIRHGDQADTTIILTADGESIWPETKRCWRGAIQIDLIGTSGHDGLLAAVSELFTARPRQRWRVAEAAHYPERHSQARTRRGASGTRRHLEPTDQAGSHGSVGQLQSQVQQQS